MRRRRLSRSVSSGSRLHRSLSLLDYKDRFANAGTHDALDALKNSEKSIKLEKVLGIAFENELLPNVVNYAIALPVQMWSHRAIREIMRQEQRRPFTKQVLGRILDGQAANFTLVSNDLGTQLLFAWLDQAPLFLKLPVEQSITAASDALKICLIHWLDVGPDCLNVLQFCQERITSLELQTGRLPVTLQAAFVHFYIPLVRAKCGPKVSKILYEWLESGDEGSLIPKSLEIASLNLLTP